LVVLQKIIIYIYRDALKSPVNLFVYSFCTVFMFKTFISVYLYFS